MTKARRYDTVVLQEPIGAFQKGDKGAVVEVSAPPYEAYDIEIVTAEGKTKGLAEAVRPRKSLSFRRCVLPPSDWRQMEPEWQCGFPTEPKGW